MCGRGRGFRKGPGLHFVPARCVQHEKNRQLLFRLVCTVSRNSTWLLLIKLKNGGSEGYQYDINFRHLLLPSIEYQSSTLALAKFKDKQNHIVFFSFGNNKSQLTEACNQ